MLRNIFKKQINNITVAAALIAISSLASRLLGVIRDRVLAGQFGAGPALDMYYASFRIPDLVYNLIILGALSSGFIPIFTSLIKDFACEWGKDCDTQSNNREAWSLANNVLNYLFLSVVSLALLGMIFTPNIIHLITPGFSSQEQAITTTLTRIMFLSPIFLGISSILGGILQSFKRFLVYSLAPVFYNFGIIIGAIFFTQWWGVYGLAWGVVLGASMHMLIQLPMVYHLGWRYHFSLHYHDKSTRKIAKMMLPRTLSLAISQINLVIITIIASSLAAGSLAVFNFANNLQSFPIGIFGISFAIAAFPSLAATAFNKEKLKLNFSQSFRQILFFIIPATVLIIALRAQIVRVVLGSGKFDWHDTILTMNTLGFFAISLFAQATIPLLVRVFYARHNSVTPFYIGLFTVAVNTALAIYLAPRMGVLGLALAFSIDSILNFSLLWIYLSIKVGDLDLGHIIKSSLKFVVSALAAGAVAQISKVLIWPYIDMTKFSGVFIQLLVSGGVGILVYAFFCYLLDSEEFFYFISSLRRRWPFKKVEIDDQGEAQGV